MFLIDKISYLTDNFVYMNKFLKYTLTIALLVPTIGLSASDNDPLEGMNRGIYSFNEVVDNAILEPVAKGYKAVLPDFAIKGVNNFYNNLRDVITVINDVLQFKGEHAINDTGRVLVNSTVGILGLIDVHSMGGGERRKEDFGQTLGYWGIGNGAYLVLPFIGPSTLRDGAGLVVDTLYLDPISYIDDVRTRNQVRVLQFIDMRAELLHTTDILDQASLDPYAFQRDAYLQYREALVNDQKTHMIDYNDSAKSDFEPYVEDQPNTSLPNEITISEPTEKKDSEQVVSLN